MEVRRAAGVAGGVVRAGRDEHREERVGIAAREPRRVGERQYCPHRGVLQVPDLGLCPHGAGSP